MARRDENNNIDKNAKRNINAFDVYYFIILICLGNGIIKSFFLHTELRGEWLEQKADTT